MDSNSEHPEPVAGDEELRKIVEDSVRHARANVGYTVNNHEAGERNISMNVETIMAATDKARLADRQRILDRVEEEVIGQYEMVQPESLAAWKSRGKNELRDEQKSSLARIQKEEL